MKALLFVLISVLTLSNPVFAQDVKVGVALPLFEDSGDESRGELGNEILNGMKFVLSEYNKTASTKVALVVSDTKRDPSVTKTILTDFGEDNTISCAIGPIFSSELSENTEEGILYKMPVISPTATGDGLAAAYNYIYQLNPSYEVRGKLMADYLSKELFMKKFAVIYEESYGINFKKHFEEETKKLGGKVIFSGSYSKDAQNITSIIDSITGIIKANDLFINISNLNLVQRQKLESSGIRNTLIDSLMSLKLDVSIYYLYGKNAKKILDTMNIRPYQLKAGTNKYIQGYIDGIYIPISSAPEINMIVPELFSSGLSFFIAGTGDWNNEKVLEDNKVYLKNLYFESEYYVNDADAAVQDLKSKLKKTKYKLSKNFLFGYDAMALMLNIIGKGNKTREQINEALRSTSGYNGIKSLISLDYHGVNSQLNILTYDNGLRKIMDYKLGKQ
jgi:ABC-type branched-subunit amino acid transport system substrate-binding protein